MSSAIAATAEFLPSDPRTDRDVADHPRHAHSRIGLAIGRVVLRVLPAGSSIIRFARWRSRRALGSSRRAGDHDDRIHVARIATAHSAPACRRASAATAASDACPGVEKARFVPPCHHGMTGNPRVWAPSADRSTTARRAATADKIGPDDEVAVGVERLAGPIIRPTIPTLASAPSRIVAPKLRGSLGRRRRATPAACASPLRAWQTRRTFRGRGQPRVLVGDADAAQLPPQRLHGPGCRDCVSTVPRSRPGFRRCRRQRRMIPPLL